MYKLLKDKSNEFQCEIRLEGTTSKNAKVRLFLEAEGCEYSFNGEISGEKCTVPMGKLKKFQNLLESGTIRLEVIADDTLFVPYENQYQLEEEKKVTVEVKQHTEMIKKPLVEVKVNEPIATPKAQPKPAQKNPISEIKKYLKENTRFDGSKSSFMNIIKNSTHKIYFNTICESNKLNKLSVLKHILN